MLFALFFPAATGIMAGANMSGELMDPRRSIPLGTLSAVAVGTVVYMVLAWWLARSATPAELVGNYTIMIDRALWGPAVLAGLLGATFSSGLASLVGAPRILQALAKWAARKVTELPPSPERSWKPSILVPVERMSQIRGGFPLLADLTSKGGSVKLLRLPGGGERELCCGVSFPGSPVRSARKAFSPR